MNKKTAVAGHICLDAISDLRGMHLERPGKFYTLGTFKVARTSKISIGTQRLFLWVGPPEKTK